MYIFLIFLLSFFSLSVIAAPLEGEISLYLFNEGEPASDTVFTVDGTHYYTDENGGARFILPAGDHLARFEFKDVEPKLWKFSLQDEEKILLIGSVSDADGKQAVELDVESSHIAKNVSSKVRSKTKLQGPRGYVLGKVISIENNTPVPGVKIYVSGIKGASSTDENGYYKIEVPAGETSISFVHGSFSAQTIRSVDINLMEELTLDIELTPLGIELSEVLIAAPSLEGGFTALVDEQRNTSSVAEVIGADQISNSGDSNAAGALKRVTGLSVVDGKYIYVRGLGERYSSTSLNGAGLPSPDPTRRVVPLDLIPAGVLESVVIQKTYAPDMPGEFGGGMVQLRTKGIPDEKKRKVSFSLGANSRSTLRQGLGYEGGSTDFLGFDNGGRDIPTEITQITNDGKKLFNTASIADQARAAESVPNNWSTENIRLKPDASFKIAAADRFESYDADWGWGYQFSMGYSNKSRFRAESQTKYDLDGTGGLIGADRSDLERTKNEVDIGGMLSLALELSNEHVLSSNTLVTRSSSNTVVINDAYLSDNDLDVLDTTLEWVERQLVTQQFTGRHEFVGLNDLRAEWVAAYSLSNRSEPFTRQYRYYEQANGSYLLSKTNDANEFSYQNLNDGNVSLGTDFSLPIYDLFSFQANIKSGFAYEAKNRNSRVLRYGFVNDWSRTSLDSSILGNAIENIFTPDNIGDSAYLLSNRTSPTDNYVASQSIFGTYVKGELDVTKSLKLMSGVRWESSVQKISTFKLLSPDEKDTVSLAKSNFLPALSATWQVKSDQQLRFALSQTVNRPDFKELSEAPYIDPETRDLVRGNKNLKPATISHVDLRWEWYLTRFETFSVASFYKQFTSPIERVIRLGGGGVNTFANVDSANIYGVEMQGRMWLSRLFGRSLSRFYVESNMALTNSSVDLGLSGSQQTTNNRPLQGQSPWLVNFTLAYENLVAKTNASLLLNVSGEIIVGVGMSGLPDSYQQPTPQLDFVFSREIYERHEDKLKFSFKMKNILDPNYTTLQNNKITKIYQKGISASASLEYKWK